MPFLGEKNAHAPRIWCAAAVVELHSNPPLAGGEIIRQLFINQVFQPDLKVYDAQTRHIFRTLDALA